MSSSGGDKKDTAGPRQLPGGDDKIKDEEATTALMKILTLSRDTPMETLQELVHQVLQSRQYAHLLPIAICYLRNHEKSLAPGTGSGERDLAERLMVALWNEDRDSGIMMLRFLVAYGSWKSLLNLLVLLDDLINASDEEGIVAEEPLVVKEPTSGGVPRRGPPRRRASSGPPRRSAANEGPYQDLSDAIHKLFAKQLRDDEATVDAVENAPGEIPIVSNAAKFAPHEGRGRHLTSAHADAIASKLFDDNDDNTKSKHQKRKLYRHLRSRLNEANQHLPDRYLAMGRADELQVNQITAGYLSKSRKALLNLPLDKEQRAAKKMRFDDTARVELRERVLKAAVDPRRVPAPSDLAELAQGLLDLANMDEVMIDEGEQTLLESTYLKAVMELTSRVKERQQDVLGLLQAFSVEGEFDATKSPSDVVVAVDVSPSQGRTFPVAALLVLLFNDTMDALAKDRGSEEDDDEKPTARRCVIFHQASESIPLPLSPSSPVNERLGSLVKSFRSAKLTVDGKDGNDYASLVELLNQEIAGRSEVAVVVCSDFSSSPEFAEAVEQSFHGPNEICCWRMIKPNLQRLREISWDPNNPRIDLCIVLDTTGSMGTYINHCKQQIQELLRTLGETAGMPVACSFVSYKDFGNPGHLETHPWVDAAYPRQMAALRNFVETLGPSGGDDAEEDIAGAFEKAYELMAERQAPSLKLVLLIADCGAHGYPEGRPRYGGVDQKDRLRKIVLKLASGHEGLGCELMLAHITSHTDLTCEAIDSWLQEERTFIDQIQMGHVSGTVFREKVLASLQEVVAHAVAPSTAKGLDVYSGTNFGVCTALLNTRLINYAAKLKEALDDADNMEEEESAEVLEMEEDTKTETLEEISTGDALPTAFQNLLSKLMSEDYNMVREAMGALKNGIFASYEAPSDQSLNRESMNALLQAGLTVQDLIDGGYPDYIIDVFKQEIKDRLSRPGK